MSLTWSDPESREPRKPEISLPLFEQSHARKDDPQTSKAAAFSMKLHANTHCWQILDALETFGPIPTGDTEKSGTGHQERIWRSL